MISIDNADFLLHNFCTQFFKSNSLSNYISVWDRKQNENEKNEKKKMWNNVHRTNTISERQETENEFNFLVKVLEAANILPKKKKSIRLRAIFC